MSDKLASEKPKSFLVNQWAPEIGNVLGYHYQLPENLKFLTGWTVYNILPNGTPQIIAPRDLNNDRAEGGEGMGIEGAKLALERFNKYFEKTDDPSLKARLWTEADGIAIERNIIRAGFNERARLAISKDQTFEHRANYNSTVRATEVGYWEETPLPTKTLHWLPEDGKTSGFCRFPETAYREIISGKARVRPVMDVPELAHNQ